MIGYFLLLTVVLPSTVVYEPSWIKMGSFAEYSVKDSAPGMNGTYVWRIIAVENSDGRNIITINETFQGTSHWDHVAVWTGEHLENTILPSGKKTKISASGGATEGLILWLLRYYNSMLVDRSHFNGIGNTYLGAGEEKMSLQGAIRDVIKVNPRSSETLAYYDKVTGILLWYRFSFRLGGYTVSLNSTNIFDAVSVAVENGSKIVLDLLSVAPLLALPLAGAIISLCSIRNSGVGFSSSFWWGVILVNGTLIALLSNWPIKVPAYSQELYLFDSLVNAAFWIFIIGTATLFVHNFMFPIIAKSSQNQLPTH